VGGKELAPLLLGFFNFVSGAQTSLPLIHSADSIFGVAAGGEVKISAVMTGRL